MIPVMHKQCGGQVGWFTKPDPKLADRFQSKYFERMDGTHPNFAEVFKEMCPHCHTFVTDPIDLTRNLQHA